MPGPPSGLAIRQRVSQSRCLPNPLEHTQASGYTPDSHHVKLFGKMWNRQKVMEKSRIVQKFSFTGPFSPQNGSLQKAMRFSGNSLWNICVENQCFSLQKHLETKATVCFFFVSRYMDEKNQWGSEIKKHKTSKKKKKRKEKYPQLHQPAPPCDDSASRMSSWSITKPTLHCLASRCCTSLGPTYREKCEENSLTFLGKSLSSYYLRQGKGPAPLQFLLKGKGKRKPRSAWRTAACSANARLRRTLHLVFFSRVFFSRVRKNQWARVTRNKEKTRRGLSLAERSSAYNLSSTKAFGDEGRVLVNAPWAIWKL